MKINSRCVYENNTTITKSSIWDVKTMSAIVSIHVRIYFYCQCRTMYTLTLFMLLYIEYNTGNIYLYCSVAMNFCGNFILHILYLRVYFAKKKKYISMCCAQLFSLVTGSNCDFFNFNYLREFWWIICR